MISYTIGYGYRKLENEMALHLSEMSTLLEQKILKSYSKLNIDEIGRVLSIGDGIARVYGLNKIQGQVVVSVQPMQCFPWYSQKSLTDTKSIWC